MREEIKEVKDFWQDYQAAVLRQGVSPAKTQWFVRWVQHFAHARPGIPLRSRTEVSSERATMLDLGEEPLDIDAMKGGPAGLDEVDGRGQQVSRPEDIGLF